MVAVALVFSLAVAALGALGVASPARLLDVVRRFQSPMGVYAATAIRVVYGLAIFLAAPASRAPGLLQVLGLVIGVAGLITPLVGLERFRRLIDWWAAHGPAFVRGWAAFALAFGLGVAWALVG